MDAWPNGVCDFIAAESRGYGICQHLAGAIQSSRNSAVIPVLSHVSTATLRRITSRAESVFRLIDGKIAAHNMSRSRSPKGLRRWMRVRIR